MRLDQIGIGADRHIKDLTLHNSRNKTALVRIPLKKEDWKPANSDHLAAHKFVHPAYMA
jgi:hypothetical protein